MHEVIRTGLTEKQRSALLAELRGMPRTRSPATSAAIATPSTS